MEDTAINSSKKMIAEIYVSSNEIINLDKYLYKPVDDSVYCNFRIFKNDTHNKNMITDEYSDFPEIIYTHIKPYGKLLNYSIIDIDYEYDMFPFYDYGRSHNVKIILLCEYEHMHTKEILDGYYIKEIEKIGIVSYYIIQDPA